MDTSRFEKAWSMSCSDENLELLGSTGAKYHQGEWSWCSFFVLLVCKVFSDTKMHSMIHAIFFIALTNISLFNYPLNELFLETLRSMNFDPETVKNPHRGSQEVRWEPGTSHPTEGVRFSCGHRVQWAQEALCVEPHRCAFRKLLHKLWQTHQRFCVSWQLPSIIFILYVLLYFQFEVDKS